MKRAIPVIPTLLVLLAVGLMISAGFWQLRRLHWKEALLARYAGAGQDAAPTAWPEASEQAEAALFRHSQLDCASVTAPAPIAGRNRAGQPGWAQLARCIRPSGESAELVLGWSADPAPHPWAGGHATGVIGPAGDSRAARLIVDPPLAGLQASALPDPRDIPNNHLAYAVQWFLFAVTALVIYAVALWKRMKG